MADDTSSEAERLDAAASRIQAVQRGRMLRSDSEAVSNAKMRVRKIGAMALNFRLVQEAQDAMYEGQRQEGLEAVEEIAEYKGREVHIDESLYSRDALMKRRAMRRVSAVKQVIDLFWNALVDYHQDSGELSKAGYVRLCAQLARAMLGKHDPIVAAKATDKDMDDIAMDDWNQDRQGLTCLGYSQFYDSIFELVDLWTEDIAPETYIQLLDWLFGCVFEADGKGYRWKCDPKEPTPPPTPPPEPPTPPPEPEPLFEDMCLYNVTTGLVVQYDEDGELELAKVDVSRPPSQGWTLSAMGHLNSKGRSSPACFKRCKSKVDCWRVQPVGFKGSRTSGKTIGEMRRSRSGRAVGELESTNSGTIIDESNNLDDDDDDSGGFRVRTDALPGQESQPIPLMFADANNHEMILHVNSDGKVQMSNLSSLAEGESSLDAAAAGSEEFLVVTHEEALELERKREEEAERKRQQEEAERKRQQEEAAELRRQQEELERLLREREEAELRRQQEELERLLREREERERLERERLERERLEREKQQEEAEATPRYPGDGKFPRVVRTALGVAAVAENWKDMIAKPEPEPEPISKWSQGLTTTIGWMAKARTPEPEELQHSPAPWFSNQPAARAAVCVSAPPVPDGRALRDYQRRMNKVPSRWKSDHSGTSRFPIDSDTVRLFKYQKPSLKLLDGFAVAPVMTPPQHFTLTQLSLEPQREKAPIQRATCAHCDGKPTLHGRQHQCTPWCHTMPPHSRTSPGSLDRLGDTFSSFTSTWDEDDFRKARSMGDSIQSRISPLPEYRPKWESSRVLRDTLSKNVGGGKIIWGNHAKVVKDIKRRNADRKAVSPNLTRRADLVWPQNLSPRSNRGNMYHYAGSSQYS